MTKTDSWALWLVALAIGLAVALLSWLLLDSLRRTPREPGEHGRQLPLWWRLLWPITATFSWHARHWQSFQRRRVINAQLQKAGLAHLLQPHHLAGAQHACGVLGVGLAVSGWTTWVGVSDSTAWVPIAALAGGAGFMFPTLWLRDRIALRQREILRGLPFVLDMTTLCVEGGLNLHGALEQAADKCPHPALRGELRHALGEMRAGAPRATALRQMAQRIGEPAVGHWISAIIQADALGMSLGPLLRAQSDQRRAERFLQAEKLALEAPVKMLFPMVAFIFPCTFIVIAFPIAIKLLDVVH